MVKFGKVAEKLAATLSVSYMIYVKCVTKKKHILGKQWETIRRDKSAHF